MSKIEEITEILVNEIDSFEKGIERLEKVSTKLHSAKISINIKELKSLLENHQNQMRAVLSSQDQIYKRYGKLLENARVYPNWAVIVFIISLLFGIGSVSFAIFTSI